MSPKRLTRRTLARPSIAAALLACLPALALAEGTNDVEFGNDTTDVGTLDATAGVVDVGWSDDKADADKYYLRVPLPEQMKTDAMGEGLRTFEEAARASQFDALDGNPATRVRTGPAPRVAGGRSGKSVKLMLPTGTLFDGRALQRVGGMKVVSTGSDNLAFSIDGASSMHGWTGQVLVGDVPGAGAAAEAIVAFIGENVLAVQLTPGSLSGSPAVRADAETLGGRRSVFLALPTTDGRLVSLTFAGTEPPPDALVSDLAGSVRLSRNTQASNSPSFDDYQAAVDAARLKRLPHLPESVASSLGFVSVQPADPDQRNRAGLGFEAGTRATAYLMLDGTVAVVGVGATGLDESALSAMLGTGPVPPFVSGSLGGYPAMVLNSPAIEGVPASSSFYVPVTGGVAMFLSIQGPGAEDETLATRIANAVEVPDWLFSGLDEATIQRSLRNQFSTKAPAKTIVAADGTVTVVPAGPGAATPVVEPGMALQAGIWGSAAYASVQGAKLLDQQLSLGLRIGAHDGAGDGGFGVFLPVHYRYLASLSEDGSLYSELSGGVELFLGAPGPGLGFGGKAAIYAPLPGIGGHLVLGLAIALYPFNDGSGPTGVAFVVGYQLPMPGMN